MVNATWKTQKEMRVYILRKQVDCKAGAGRMRIILRSLPVVRLEPWGRSLCWSCDSSKVSSSAVSAAVANGYDEGFCMFTQMSP